MSLHDLLVSIQDLPVAVTLAESALWFPLVETVHVFALTLVVGSIAMLDLRLLQVASRDVSVTRLTKDVLPWTWGAFLLAVASGSLMFASKAVAYAANVPFRIKLVLLVLAGLNMLLFHFITYKTVPNWDDESRTPTLARVAGGLSLFFWIGVVAAGRWIGFTV